MCKRSHSACACMVFAWTAAAAAQSPFATRVIAYEPAPGQRVNDDAFKHPQCALGAPIGGGPSAADNTKVVTLGGFGGTITLGFDHAIANRPAGPGNPLGLDLIVFGNAFYPGGNSTRRWAEPGVIEVSIDANHNGLADDAWYVIAGSHIAGTPQAAVRQWSDVVLNPSWVPPGRSGQWQTRGFVLSAQTFAPGGVPVLVSTDAETEAAWGYADCTPVMVLGDLDGDGLSDAPGMSPEMFYTKPDDPRRVGMLGRSCGGDAVDIEWAVDATGQPVHLAQIDFVRITTAVDSVNGLLGEVSTEIGGVAEVRPWLIADLGTSGNPDPDAGPDGFITGEDFDLFVMAFFKEFRDGRGVLIADIATAGAGTFGPDGFVTGEDFDAFVIAYFMGI